MFRGFTIFGGNRQPPMGQAMRSTLFFNGLISLLFGLLVIAAPELISYLIGGAFVFFGASMLLTWWRMR